MLVFAYWFYYINTSHVVIPKKDADKLTQLERKEKTSSPIVEDTDQNDSSRKREINEQEVLSNAQNLRSSSRNPIRLESKRNYVTGKNVTFMVPDDMRRIRLSIQERNGRQITSYSLPNSFISIKAGQRINLKVE